MARELSIVQLDSEDSPEVGRLIPEAGEVIVGRAPEGDDPNERTIRVSSYVVSRRHGVFCELKSHWLFKDLGSTNGSWLNGVPLRPHHWRVVRPGNILALADVNIELRTVTDDEDGYEEKLASQRSILVFDSDTFVNEFRIAGAGQQLSIGGDGATFPLDGYEGSAPAVTFALDGLSLRVERHLEELPVSINSSEITGALEIFDGDVVEVGPFSILFNDPISAPRKPEIKVPSREESVQRDSEGAARAENPSLFGKVDFSDEKIRRKTQVINPAEFRRALGGAPGEIQTHYREEAIPESTQPRRFIPRTTWEALDLNAMEDLVVMVFAGILVLGLLLTGLYFLLR